jgi:phosphatidylglycerol---prolipoprotein diacylglyceryl transferase
VPAATLRTVFDFTPDPIAIRIGPLEVHWYGVAYAVGLAAVYFLLTRLAARRGRDPELVANGMLVVALAALIGGRLYHVIDQWQLYRDNPLAIVLPPYSGLGVYGGIVTGTIAAWAYVRRKGEPFWEWADIVAPGLFLMQAIGRWGNFFNQELYGPPTDLPWGIPIACANRVSPYLCDSYPATTHFQPLFLYESLSGLLGMLFLLYLGGRFRHRLRPGDLLFVFFIWYGVVRFALETLRSGNWTFFGIPTAQLVSLAFVGVGIAGLIVRHRSRPAEAIAVQAPEPAASTPAREPGPPPPDGPPPKRPTRARRTREADRGT